MNNISIYNERMEKGMIDKLFFLEHIPKINLLVDLGCANASIFKSMRMVMGDDSTFMTYVGYDISQQMLDLAEHNLNTNDKENNKLIDVKLTSDWGVVKDIVRDHRGTKVLLLSSVIHEIYSYCDKNEILEFWSRVWSTGFDYVVIRDMLPYQSIWNRFVNDEEFKRIKKQITSTKLGEKQFNDYVSRWKCDGTKSYMREGDLIHFLLKYKYIENWNRELNENYFSCFLNDVIKESLNNDYDVEYLESFILPYFKDWVENEFNYTIEQNTHVKLILKKP